MLGERGEQVKLKAGRGCLIKAEMVAKAEWTRQRGDRDGAKGEGGWYVDVDGIV